MTRRMEHLENRISHFVYLKEKGRGVYFTCTEAASDNQYTHHGRLERACPFMYASDKPGQ
jgi:hypothetical protein